MSLPIYQRVAVNASGDVIPGAEYSVVNEATGLAFAIYSDRGGATLKSAPYFADANGVIQFFIAAGTTFRVVATGGVGTYADRYVYAAYAQESATDTTAGRVMTVGAGGLLGDGVAATDLNLTGGSSDVTGFMSVASSITGVPAGSSRAGVIKFGRAATERSMLYADPQLEKLYIRHRYSYTPNTWNDWQELYHTGNILGTVSQSGGVPTGAVIQRGSNANGEFVRFADGTQICQSVPLTLSANASSSMTGTFNFPVGFFSQPVVTFKVTSAALNWSPSITFLYGQFAEDGLSSSALVLTLSGTVTVTTSGVRAMAIGRWY